jgi:DNA repair exonuclease SbcCD ATPase subunit
MKKLLKDNWIPLVISAAALVLATGVGLVPVLRTADKVPSSTQAALDQRLTTLEGKIENLTANRAETEDNQPKVIDPALRAELDQIVKGLVNQTGRVSRLKKDISPILAWGKTPPVPDRIEQQITLINQALLRQTGRIRSLQSDVARVEGIKADAERMILQIKNLESAVKQLHKRITGLSAQQKTIEAAPVKTDGSALKSIEAKLDAMLKTLQSQ